MKSYSADAAMLIVLGSFAISGCNTLRNQTSDVKSEKPVKSSQEEASDLAAIYQTTYRSDDLVNCQDLVKFIHTTMSDEESKGGCIGDLTFQGESDARFVISRGDITLRDQHLKVLKAKRNEYSYHITFAYGEEAGSTTLAIISVGDDGKVGSNVSLSDTYYLSLTDARLLLPYSPEVSASDQELIFGQKPYATYYSCSSVNIFFDSNFTVDPFENSGCKVELLFDKAGMSFTILVKKFGVKNDMEVDAKTILTRQGKIERLVQTRHSIFILSKNEGSEASFSFGIRRDTANAIGNEMTVYKRVNSQVKETIRLSRIEQ